MKDALILVLFASLNVISIIICIKLLQKSQNNSNILQNELPELTKENFTQIQKEITNELNAKTQMQVQISEAQAQALNTNLTVLQNSLTSQMEQMQRVMSNFENSNVRNLCNLQESVTTSMKELKNETSKQMQEIKGTVDEQLQSTLDRKLKESFDSVVQQLTMVTKGLGEMSTLANSVGDLKKTLSNVKTRGILGEIQLGAILEQILSKDQYETNVVTVKGTNNPVEYAIKLPGNGNGPVWLPIDSKFPADTYNNLLDAYDTGNMAQIEECGKLLEGRILQEAKDISTKYVKTPDTTEFAIMFLPTEGLYAEVLRRGLLEKLQTRYKVMIAGPTTMAALLNSLYMGFKTLAVSQRANEVITLLGNVKSEFDKYQGAVDSVSKRLAQTTEEFEKLVGTRTRMLNRQLDKITTSKLLEDETKLPLIEMDN